jgi:hypothetical protein
MNLLSSGAGMTTSPIERWAALAQAVHVTADSLTVDLTDGRSIAVPLAWYPRLAHATPVSSGTGDLLGEAKAFTGRISTRISASRISSVAHVPGRVSALSNSGLSPVRLPHNEVVEKATRGNREEDGRIQRIIMRPAELLPPDAHGSLQAHRHESEVPARVPARAAPERFATRRA